MNIDLSRRTVIAGFAIAAATAMAPARAQSLRPARLLVARRRAPIPSSNCASPCIRGSIFDVSDIDGPIMPAAIVASGRAAICDVVERPWANNTPSVSAIPKGVYAAHIRTDATKTWMRATPARAWRIELSGVSGGRSAIQFHYGLDERWSEGCFIVGERLAPGAAYCQLVRADAALATLRAHMEATGLYTQTIQVTVADTGDLFAGAATHC